MKAIKSALLAGMLFSFSITCLYPQEKDVLEKDAQRDLYKEASWLDAQRTKELATARTELNKEMDAAMREAMALKIHGKFAEKRGNLEQKYNEKVEKIEQNYAEKRSKFLLSINIEQGKLRATERELVKLDEEYYNEMKKFSKENDRENLEAMEEFMKEGKNDKYREKVNSLQNKYVEKADERERKYIEKRDKIYTTQFGEIYKYYNEAEQKKEIDKGNLNK